jgi:hypothetical protein
MSRLAAGLLLALAASAALNGGYVLQHVGAAGAPAVDPRRPVRTLRALLGSRAWLVGGALGMTGWGLHVGALTRAPLSLVQAFVAGGIVLVAPWAAAAAGRRLSPAEWRGVALMAGALALLGLGLHGGARAATFAPAGLAAYLAAAAAAAGALAVVGGFALGLAAGALYGAADVAIKALTAVAAGHGLAAVATSPWLAAAAACSVGAFFAFQRALQADRPVTVIALMTAGTNVVSIAGGLLVFGEPLGRTPGLAVLHAVAFLLVGAAAWLLAPAQAAAPAPARRVVVP